MSSIKDSAINYISPVTLNISELNKISVDVEVFEKTGQKEDGTEFSYLYFKIAEQEYRMPVSVLKDLKEQLKEIPDLKFFKVSKTGTGKYDTKYTVIPLVK
jgi:hypothetical protein